MATDFDIRPIWDDSEFKAGVMSSISDLNKMENEIKDVQNQTEKSNKAMGDSIQGTSKKIADQEKTVRDAGKETIVYSKALEDAANNVNILGVNVGGTIRNLKSKQAALKGMVSGLGTGVKGLKAFKIALASTGIGLIVVALGSLVAWLTRTQEGLDKVERVLSSVSAAGAVIIDRFAKIGGALVGLVTGQKTLTEAWNEGKEAVSGIAAEMAEEAKQAGILTGQLQKLKREEEELTVKRAQSRAEIKRLNKIAEDTTKSDLERSNAAKEAIAIETELAEDRKRILEQQLEAQKALDDQGISTFEDLKEQRRLKTEIAQADQESLELQTTLQNKLNTIQQQRTAKIAEESARLMELRDTYAALLATVTGRVEDEEADTPFKRARLEVERSLELLDEQKQKFIEVGQAAGIAPQEIERGLLAFEKLESSLKVRLNFIAGREEGDDVVETLKSGVIDPLRDETLELNPTVVVNPEVDTSGFGFDRFKQDLLDGLGITEEEAQQVLDSLSSVLNDVQAIFLQSIQSRIAALDEEIATRQENRENLEEELEAQEELEAEGFANKAEATRQAIEEEIQAEEKAIEERDRLRRKEQQAKEIVNIATQVSSLITAGAQIFSAESSKGVVGVGLAIAAIAGMLASFAALKADAKKSTKLFVGTGTLSDHLPSGMSAKSDRTSKGYQLHDGDTGAPTGIFVGGDEGIMRSELSEHADFFDHMNQNHELYKGMDLLAMARGRKSAVTNIIQTVKNAPDVHYIQFNDPETGQPWYIKKVNGQTVERMLIEV